MSGLPPGKDPGLTDRTMMVQAPTFNRAGRAWRDFAFGGLEKVSRTQVLLARRLEWLLPGISPNGSASEEVRARLTQLFDDEVRLVQDYVHVIAPKALKKYVGDPTFLAVLSPMPHKTRGFLEIELGLAHAAIDMLLGGAGETVSLRSLTDIEQGVLSYLVIEALKALAPSVDPGLPRLRLEGLCHGVDEAVQLLGDEQLVAVLQLKVHIGTHSGYLRLFVPATVLGMTNPPADSPERRVQRNAEVRASISRLAGVKTFLRAEIGHAEISSTELIDLRERDVVLVDRLTARPDKGEGGRAQLRVGAGRTGCAEAEVVVEGGRLKARITGFSFGETAREAHDAGEPSAEVEQSPDAGGAGESELGSEPTGPVEDSTNPNVRAHGGGNLDESKNEGAELLNDIPLQIAVELARVAVTADEVVALRVGQVIDLNRIASEPVELSVNGKIVARGELVEVEGHLGVRVVSLAG